MTDLSQSQRPVGGGVRRVAGLLPTSIILTRLDRRKVPGRAALPGVTAHPGGSAPRPG
jgi:hypothetical protein